MMERFHEIKIILISMFSAKVEYKNVLEKMKLSKLWDKNVLKQ